MKDQLIMEEQAVWKFDLSHTKVGFHATHLVITDVYGEFKTFDGNVLAGSADFQGSEVNFTADAASISTGIEARDNHLKSDDFFNAEKFPNIVFRGKLLKTGHHYKLKGDLTIRDITKPVEFDVNYMGTVKDPFTKAEKAGFKITGAINRFDFNLKWNVLMEAGGAVVGKEIKLDVNAELEKQS